MCSVKKKGKVCFLCRNILDEFVDLFGDDVDIMRRKMEFLLNIILKLKKRRTN